MATEQDHESVAELSSETRTFSRMIAGLVDDAEAIGWHNREACAIKENDQKDEFKHFGMDPNFLLRRKKE